MGVSGTALPQPTPERRRGERVGGSRGVAALKAPSPSLAALLPLPRLGRAASAQQGQSPARASQPPQECTSRPPPGAS